MFKEISVNKIEENPFHLIGKQWMLITAGGPDSFNTMTAAWGGFGYLWNLPVTSIFIRPQRYTFEFTEKNDFYTLSFFEKKHKNILTYCGTHSGKDYNKTKDTGLVLLETDLGNIYFEQARLVFECKKLYYDDIKPEHFADRLIQRNYPKKDYHRMYIGKVMKCLVNEDET
ncbi:MAG TPA: flavin reductase [Bacteroidales bacterium]|nr:flavin reductase [Bacteroidales bacterium]HRX97231.1 flavin reductase [Bacteroidales bacterium]